MTALRDRLQPFCKRMLRRQVVEYIQYTERRPLEKWAEELSPRGASCGVIL